MANRTPTAAEAIQLAALLKERGYDPAEAATQYRSAFPAEDPDGIDGCLMFEGPNILHAEAVAHEWGALTEEQAETALASWLNAVLFGALLTLAAEAGEPDALRVRAEDIAYAEANWN